MFNKGNRALAATAIALVMLLGACRPATPVRTSLKPEGDRKPAPDFTLKDADGKMVKLSDYRGKVVLLNFWATWCGPCKIEIPWFMEFEQKYKDQGFAVLGVSMDEDGWDAVKPYIRAKKVNYRVLLGDDTVGNLYGGIESLPTTFLIDQTGKVASVHIGLVNKKDYSNEIDSLIGTSKSAALTGSGR